MDVVDAENQSPNPTLNKSSALQSLITTSLPSSLAKLKSSSSSIPSNKDFHFYYNFDQFKLPVKSILTTSESILHQISSSADVLFHKVSTFPKEDMDEGLDWVVGINDEILERVDGSLDEFEKMRKRKEEGGGIVFMEDDGFQLVGRGRKVSKVDGLGEKSSAEDLSGVKMAFKDRKSVFGSKAKIPFHIPTIKRPQDEYKILVNNANQPFEHVWLERSEDGSRFVHPLEKLSILDFVDENLGTLNSVEPPSLESTPFKLVQEVKDLKELAAILHGVDEFAVDLEHNHYRSFQGLTCLMQISTRTEDFIVDTLKLRVHVGPYLRDVFKDPSKKKVMHGADRDIVWLQRDFGIYICNLFDTGQASRVLTLERNSLEFLLHHFCGVSANKEYQNADWRLRPLPAEMIRYAREDTHYLLYIYDLLKIKLTKAPRDPEKADDPLLEVYKRSYEICMQFYEKELLTEDSYLYIYGLPSSNFNAQQLAIAAGLCEWRDHVARAEDESTGYILPNKTLLEIAKQMPVTVSKLRRLVKSKHPYIERNIGSVLSIIFHGIQNASAFEAVAEQLKLGALNVTQEESIPIDAPATMEVEDSSTISVPNTVMTGGDMTHNNRDSSIGITKTQHGLDTQGCLHANAGNQSNTSVGSYGFANENTVVSISSETEMVETSGQSAKVSATIQVAKKPSRGFGALFGAGPVRKSNPTATDKDATKLEQIKSSVTLPFHSFAGTSPVVKPTLEQQVKSFEVRRDEEVAQPSVTNGDLEDIIELKDDTSSEKPDTIEVGNTSADAEKESKQEDEDGEDEAKSLSDLSSSFRKCFQPRQPHNHKESSALLNFKPFDYEEARKKIKFGNSLLGEDGTTETPGRKGKKKNTSVTSQERRLEESGGFQPGRRSQAFPVTGNRSATFKSP